MTRFSSRVDFSKTEIGKLTETIKAQRAMILRQGGHVFVHRKIPNFDEHLAAESCPCDPIVITNNDWRCSMEFAYKALNPALH